MYVYAYVLLMSMLAPPAVACNLVAALAHIPAHRHAVPQNKIVPNTHNGTTLFLSRVHPRRPLAVIVLVDLLVSGRNQPLHRDLALLAVIDKRGLDGRAEDGCVPKRERVDGKRREANAPRKRKLR